MRKFHHFPLILLFTLLAACFAGEAGAGAQTNPPPTDLSSVSKLPPFTKLPPRAKLPETQKLQLAPLHVSALDLDLTGGFAGISAKSILVAGAEKPAPAGTDSRYGRSPRLATQMRRGRRPD